MKNHLVSVVLCTFNGREYVEAQLNSICNQSYSNLEIIIVDDASTDGTFELLQRISGDPRIRLFRNPENMGFNLNFSKACNLANGEFIAISDQDDVWEEKKVEILVNEFHNNPDVMLVHGISARFREKGRPSLSSIRLVRYFEGNDLRQLFLFNSISGHNMIFRRILLEKALPFPPNVYYDWWLVLIACTMGRISHVDKILVWHRVHSSNATGAGKPILPYYRMMQSSLPTFLSMDGMDESDRAFAKKLLEFYREFPKKAFSANLFLFLVRKRKVIFAHKRRKLALFSHLKNAFKYSMRSTIA